MLMKRVDQALPQIAAFGRAFLIASRDVALDVGPVLDGEDFKQFVEVGAARFAGVARRTTSRAVDHFRSWMKARRVGTFEYPSDVAAEAVTPLGDAGRSGLFRRPVQKLRPRSDVAARQWMARWRAFERGRIK